MEELQHHWRTEKILTLEQATQKAEELRKQGKKIVTLNGSFDLLHAGHLDILEEAKMQGDILVVGINSDFSIRGGKGESRPYIGQQERAALLAALTCVDMVVIVDAPYKGMESVFVRAIKPNIHVNGSEYGTVDTWLEKPAMDEVGAQGYLVSRRPGFSSSEIITKIKNS